MLRIFLVLVMMAVTTTAEGAWARFICEARTITPYEGYDDWLSVEAKCRKDGRGGGNERFERVRIRVRLGNWWQGSFGLHVVHLDRKEDDDNLGYWARFPYTGWKIHQGGEVLSVLYDGEFRTSKRNLTHGFFRIGEGVRVGPDRGVGPYYTETSTVLAYRDTLVHLQPHWPGPTYLDWAPYENSIGDVRNICTEAAPCQLTFHYSLYHKDDFVPVRQMLEMAIGNTGALSRLRDELEREQAQRVAGLRDSVLVLETELHQVKRNRDELQKQLQMQEECDENAVRGDFNGDGRVNFSDFLIFVGLYEANN